MQILQQVCIYLQVPWLGMLMGKVLNIALKGVTGFIFYSLM